MFNSSLDSTIIINFHNTIMLHDHSVKVYDIVEINNSFVIIVFIVHSLCDVISSISGNDHKL